MARRNLNLAGSVSSISTQSIEAMNLIEAGKAYTNPLSDITRSQNSKVDHILDFLPAPTGEEGDPWTYERYNKMRESLGALKVQNTSCDSHVSDQLSDFSNKVNSTLQAANIDNIRNGVATVDRCQKFLTEYFGLSSGYYDGVMDEVNSCLNIITDALGSGSSGLSKLDDIVDKIITKTAELWNAVEQETGLASVKDSVNKLFSRGSGITGLMTDPCVVTLAKNTMTPDMKKVLNIN